MKGFIEKLIKKYPTLWEIFKFLLIGGLATIVDYLFMALTLYLFNPSAYNSFLSLFIGDYSPTTLASVVSTGVGFCFGLIFNYIFSIIFVFSASDTSKAKGSKGFIAFTLLSLIGLAIHIVGMYVGYDLCGINEWIMKIILTAVVLVFNYVSRKLLLFNREKAPRKD